MTIDFENFIGVQALNFSLLKIASWKLIDHEKLVFSLQILEFS